MVTLSLVLTSLVFCIVLGLPPGDFDCLQVTVPQGWTRPILDTPCNPPPAFVYLVPAGDAVRHRERARGRS